MTTAAFDDTEWAAVMQHSGEPAPAPSSWRPVDLAPILAGGHVDPPPTILCREDGPALHYAGKLHSGAGESESLKSWLEQYAAVQVLIAGGTVEWIDYEDSAPAVVGRLVALGCPAQRILDGFRYIRPAEPLSVAATAQLVAERPVLAVLDGVTEGMALQGLDPNSNSDVARFLTLLPRPLASTGAAVVLLDHVPKTRDSRGQVRYAIGAQHKLAAVDGAAFIVELVQPFGHGRHGIAKVVIAKDRPGRVREHSNGSVVAELHLRSHDDGTVTASLLQPTSDRTEEFRPTALMERVSRLLEGNPDGLSGNQVEQMVKGKAAYIRKARDLLVRDGHLTTAKTGTTTTYAINKPYRADTDTTISHPDEDPS